MVHFRLQVRFCHVLAQLFALVRLQVVALIFLLPVRERQRAQRQFLLSDRLVILRGSKGFRGRGGRKTHRHLPLIAHLELHHLSSSPLQAVI